MGQLVYGAMDFEKDYGVIVDSAESWEKPERDRELVHVPGRNGDLILDNGSYKNVEITYHCLIKDGWQDKFSEFCDHLYTVTGYSELFDSEHPHVYRMAELVGPITPELWFTSDTGVFDLVFNCKPQQYIVPSVDLYMDFSSADITKTYDNPYYMWTYPKIKAYAPGGAVLDVGDWTVKIAAQNDYDGIMIDCEAEVCYGIDNFEGYQGPAAQYVTFIPPMYGYQNPEQRNYPSLPYGVGLTVTAYHEIWNYDDDPDNPTLETYTGTAEVKPRLTRI